VQLEGDKKIGSSWIRRTVERNGSLTRGPRARRRLHAWAARAEPRLRGRGCVGHGRSGSDVGQER
jgi:hypothetical protein